MIPLNSFFIFLSADFNKILYKFRVFCQEFYCFFFEKEKIIDYFFSAGNGAVQIFLQQLDFLMIFDILKRKIYSYFMEKEFNKENIRAILKKEYLYLKANFGVHKIALFGSFSTNTQSKKSDIDILIEFKKPIGFKFIELADYLENQLGRKVYILTPEGIHSIRIKRIAENIKNSLVYV